MGMKIGSSPGSNSMALIQISQMTQKAAPISTAIAADPAPVTSAKDQQIQNWLNIMRGQGNNIDTLA